MNNFTKEELQTLHRLIDDDINDESGYVYVTSYHDNLKDKIQSLIDNYCEHSGNIAYHEWKTCNDCGQPFYE
jgi:hypothetical protein